MPNWCSTSYVIEGSKKELKKLYNLLDKLEKKSQPKIRNGFGTSWLGCLVDALGADWNKVHCRGEFGGVELYDDHLTLWTETAWGPCDEVFDLLCEKFPSLRVYYMAEEPGMCLYVTNDANGDYFKDRAIVTVNSKQTDYITEYFESKEEAFKWLANTFDCTVRNMSDVECLSDALESEDEDYFVKCDEIEVE